MPQLEPLEVRVVPSTWTVENANASGPNSLLAAVANANSDTSAALINFDPWVFTSATTVTLTSPLTLSNTSHSITIDGSGAGPLTVSGGGSVQVFCIGSGVTATIANLTITDGSANGGGGISNAGTLTVSGCTITSNEASACGGGIFSSGSLSLSGSTISENTAGSWSCGGGIYNLGSAAVSNCTISSNSGRHGGGIYSAINMAVSGCTITSNESTGYGGGIFGGAGSLSISGSTISENTAGTDGSHGGGGIYVGESVTVSDCTIADNQCGGDGGGILNNEGKLIVNSSTISDNSSCWGGGGVANLWAFVTLINCSVSGNTAGNGSTISDGGGILNYGTLFSYGTLTLVNVTVAGNSASGNGGGIMNAGELTVTNATISDNFAAYGGGIYSPDFTATLANTIVAGNTAVFPDISGSVSGSHNLIGDNSGMTGLTNGDNGNLVGTSTSPINAMLGTLTNNGGPTLTMMPQLDSPAFGTGDSFAQLSDGVDESVTSVTVTNGMSFAANDLSPLASGSYCTIQVGSEQMAVTAVNQVCLPSYLVGDTLTVVGGSYSTAATLTVTSVTANGFVAGVSVANPGCYSVLPSGIVSVTGGNGTGAKFDLYSPNYAAPYSISWAWPLFGGDLSTVLSLTRGVNGTTPATHAANASVFLVSDQRNLLPAYATPAVVNIGAVQGTSALIVTTASDEVSHTGTSLRDALTTANADAANGQSDTILFDPDLAGQTISLVQGTLALDGAGSGTITIDASSLSSITVNGGNAVEDLSVSSGVTAHIKGLTITGGSASGDGGGIFNAGSLTLTSCDVSGNSATANGGGLFSDGYAGVNNCVFTLNDAPGYGGSVFNDLGGTLSVSNTVLSDSTAGGGGGVGNLGSATISDCSLSADSASWSGGGIYNNGTLAVSDGTIADCVTSGNGGGIGNDSLGVLSIYDSTITGDSTMPNAYDGGGISNAGRLTMSYSALDLNTAYYGGGLYNNGGAATLTAGNEFSSNTAIEYGGCIYAGWGSLVINDCRVVSSLAAYGGGGIYCSAWLDITNATIANNSVSSGGGGGIDNEYGYLKLTSSTVCDNSASDGGDEIRNNWGTATITSSILSHYATQGEGIRNSGTLTLTGNSIVGNSVGIYAADGSITNVHFNRIVSNSTAIDNESSATIDATDNWWGSNSSALGSQTVIGNVDANPWQVFQAGAGADVIPISGSTSVNGNLNHNSNGEDLTAEVAGLGGATMTFELTAGTGTLTGSSTNMEGGTAITAYSASGSSGTATFAVTLDGVAASVSVVINSPPTAVDGPYEIQSSWWKFNEGTGTTTADTMTGGQVTLPSGVSWSSDAPMAGTYSLDFGSASGPLQAYGSTLGTSDFSLSLWVKWTSPPYLAVPLAGQDDGAGNSWSLAMSDSGHLLQFTVAVAGASPVTLLDQAWSPSAATWYHLTVTHSGSSGASTSTMRGALVQQAWQCLI